MQISNYTCNLRMETGSVLFSLSFDVDHLQLSGQKLYIHILTLHTHIKQWRPQSSKKTIYTCSTKLHTYTDSLLLLLVRLHDQSSSSDAVGGLLQVLQAPIYFLVKRSCWWPLCDSLWLVSVTSLWRTCSVVWFSPPQEHVGEGTNFSFLCMCALSLLWPERSRTKTTWPGLSRRWYASSYLGFSAILTMVVISW